MTVTFMTKKIGKNWEVSYGISRKSEKNPPKKAPDRKLKLWDKKSVMTKSKSETKTGNSDNKWKDRRSVMTKS